MPKLKLVDENADSSDLIRRELADAIADHKAKQAAAASARAGVKNLEALVEVAQKRLEVCQKRNSCCSSGVYPASDRSRREWATATTARDATLASEACRAGRRRGTARRSCRPAECRGEISRSPIRCSSDSGAR